MKKLLLLIFPCIVFAQEIPTKELKLEKMIRVYGNYEPSGGAFRDSVLLFVSDDLTDRQLYQLDFKTGNVSKDLDLKLGIRVIDLEGLAYCKDTQTYFVANERAREILKIGSTVETLAIDDEDVQKGGANAGLEGVAIDCEKNILYAAKERDPRMLYVFDLKNIEWGKANKPIEKFDLPLPDIRKVKVKKLGIVQEIDLNPDFADLAFHDGKLFVLERNAHRISVWDPSLKKVILRYSYAHLRDHEYDDNQNGKIQKSERGLFDTKEPFGIAEGLVINEAGLYLLLDNNDTRLSTWAAKKYKLEKTADPLVLQFLIQ